MTPPQTIVISAVNFFEGGPLSILYDCLEELSSAKYASFQVVVLVHRSSLFENKNYPPHIVFKAFPQSRKSYWIRLYYEFWLFYKLSKQLSPYLWFSLHDISPRVKSYKKVVYWQSPSPFYTPRFQDIWKAPKLLVHSFLYRHVLQFNHRSNDWIIVQQQWIREQVSQWFKIPPKKIMIALPVQAIRTEVSVIEQNKDDIFRFFYPSLARPHKNFEILGEACQQLLSEGIISFELILTIDGSENSYAQRFFQRFQPIKNIKFLGKLSRKAVFVQYEKCDALVFPSRLETWGLPISEFIFFNKPILVADLPYAYETVGRYDKVKFLSPNQPKVWAEAMKKMIQKENLDFSTTQETNLLEPLATNWAMLFNKILS